MTRGRIVGVALVLLGNLLPVWAVATGRMSLGDVLAVYWLENVVIGGVAVVKILTALGVDEAVPRSVRMLVRGDAATVLRVVLASFFVVHYGIFALVHGTFVAVLADQFGSRAGPRFWLLTALGLVLVHVVSLALDWFADGGRYDVSPPQAATQPYARVIPLHLAILGGSFLLLVVHTSAVWPVVLLCLAKTCYDLRLLLRGRGGGAPDGLPRDPLAAPTGTPVAPADPAA